MRSPGRIILYLIGAFLALIVLSFLFFVCILPVVGLAITAPQIQADAQATATAQARTR